MRTFFHKNVSRFLPTFNFSSFFIAYLAGRIEQAHNFSLVTPVHFQLPPGEISKEHRKPKPNKR